MSTVWVHEDCEDGRAMKEEAEHQNEGTKA
jgi:hypothetical protein